VHKHYGKTYALFALALVLLAGLLVLLRTGPAAGAAGDTHFTNVVATGHITAGDNLTVGEFAALSRQGVVTVTNSGAITPGGSYQPLVATTAVGAGAIASSTLTAGQLLFFTNIGTPTITLTDTGRLRLSGNAALGQYDTITLLFDGEYFIETAQTDN
jgi:hypothetical protein